jgi:hypothetical protein
MPNEAREAWGDLMAEIEFLRVYFQKIARSLSEDLDYLRDGDFNRNLDLTYKFLKETEEKVHHHARKTAVQGVVSPFDEKEKANTLTKIERTKTRMILDLNLLQTYHLPQLEGTILTI